MEGKISMYFLKRGGNAPKWFADPCFLCVWLLLGLPANSHCISLVLALDMSVTEDFLGTVLHLKGDL